MTFGKAFESLCNLQSDSPLIIRSREYGTEYRKAAGGWIVKRQPGGRWFSPFGVSKLEIMGEWDLILETAGGDMPVGWAADETLDEIKARVDAMEERMDNLFDVLSKRWCEAYEVGYQSGYRDGMIAKEQKGREG